MGVDGTVRILNDKWEQRFFRIAEEVATWSKDPHRQVGAVLVRDKRIVATGYNGLPSGILDDPLLLADREAKLAKVIHAELNALLNAGKHGVPVEGCTLYVTYPPCNHCALAILQSGVSKVVTTKPKATSRWCNSQKMSLELFHEAGVEIIFSE